MLLPFYKYQIISLLSPEELYERLEKQTYFMATINARKREFDFNHIPSGLTETVLTHNAQKMPINQDETWLQLLQVKGKIKKFEQGNFFHKTDLQFLVYDYQTVLAWCAILLSFVAWIFDYSLFFLVLSVIFYTRSRTGLNNRWSNIQPKIMGVLDGELQLDEPEKIVEEEKNEYAKPLRHYRESERMQVRKMRKRRHILPGE